MLNFKDFIEEDTLDEVYDPVKSKIKRLHNKFDNRAHMINDKDVDYAMSTKDTDLHRKVFEQTVLNGKHIDIGMKSHDPDVRSAAVSHYIASPVQIHRGLRDPDVSVRLAALTNPQASQKHSEFALNDPHPLVRHVANLNIQENAVKNRAKPKPSFLSRIKKFISR